MRFNTSRGRSMLPPHSRGCTWPAPPSAWMRNASPALAGMYLLALAALASFYSFPRTRGDVPAVDIADPTNAVLPPHSRGCTRALVSLSYPDNASPALAGMYRRNRALRIGGAGFPRTRGDVPCAHVLRLDSRQLPPHSRGCTFDLVTEAAYPFASPALAGMYRRRVRRRKRERRFPRTRGDVPFVNSATASQPKLPPHSRGCTL